MTYAIWLDDIRPTPSGSWVGVCSVNQAKTAIATYEQLGGTEFILDLDHDLGDYFEDGGDAVELVKWLIETGRNTQRYKVRLHTMNPIGRMNMQALIDRYWKD